MIWGPQRSLRLILATVAGGVALSIFWMSLPDREVMYSRALRVVGCAKAADPCYAWARLSIGNTGNVDQGVVQFRLPGGRAQWQVHADVSDIRASLEERARPRVDRVGGTDAALFEIRPLPRNKVVDLNAYCMACPPELIRGAEASHIAVQGEGRTLEGDPRAVTLFGAALRFAAMLIPF